MKIKVPKTIKIGVHEYGIVYNPLLWHEDAMKGCVNHLKQKIEIDPALAPSQKLVTLLHEINHIITDTLRCKLDDDETDRMAQGMAELLFNNLNIEFDWGNIPTGDE